MALVLKDRVKESSSSSGTGNITLTGAFAGYQTFAAAIPNGSVVYYCIHNLVPGFDTEWEVGYGTFTSPSTLSRDFVYESSNAGSLVNFTSGTEGLEVFVTQPAEQAIYQETNGDLKLVDGVITVSIDGTEGNTLANTTYQAFGTVNNFIQMNQQNLSNGSDASTDYVATNDTGDDTKNYIDLGIGSSGYSSVDFPLHKANDGYLYVIGDGVNSANLVVGTGNTGNVIVHTGGINTPNIVAVFDGNQDASFANNVSITANVSANNANFTTAAYASANLSLITQANQLVTKEYVDNSTSAGLHIHEPVLVETTGNLNATYAQGGTTFNITDTISPNTVVTSVAHGLSQNDQIWLTTTAGNGLSTNTAYFVFSTPNATSLTLSTNFGGAQYTGISNGSSLTYATRANSGVGATLTNAGANVALTVDGVSLANTNRVMVRLQTNQNENGVYEVTNPGNGSAQWVLTRAADADYFSPVDTNGLGEGDYFYTQSGNLNAGDSHVLTTPGNIIIGYTNLTYTQFSGSVTYTGVSPINVSGQTISLTGTVPATNGGTGANTVAVGDLLYGSATDTWSKLPLGAAYKPLVVNASGTQVEWNALALNQTAAVSGNLAATNGGTGIGSYTQGEMLYANTTTQLDKVTPNQTTTRKFLSQTGTGTTANAPGWNQPDAADITGLGTMATQNANSVTITGGTLDNVVIGSNTAANGTFTNVSSTNVSATNGLFTNVSGNGAAISAINASNISSGTIANDRTTASTSNSSSTIVARDADGSFGANIVTATFSGNGASLSAINASNISSGTIANARTTAASANGASTIVQRDSGGNFSANTVTAAVIGDLSGGSNINASNISSGTIANARTTASSSNGASTIVLRDAGGAFAAGAITATSLSGNGASITDINASAITTGTLDNARTTASSANGASTIVARDSGGNFSANTVTAINFNGTINGAINATSITDSGNLTFTGTGNRITGDMTNATLSNRVAFQTSTSNTTTILSVIPNGTGTSSAIQFYNNSSDLENASVADFRVVGTTDVRVTSTRNGTGTFLPLTMYTGGSERLRIDTSGNVGIGTSSPANSLDVVADSNANAIGIRGRSSDNQGYLRFLDNGATTAYSLIGAPAANTLAFYTNGFNERMRIDSSGNIFAPFNTQSTSLVVGGNGTTSSLGARVCIRSAISAGASLNYAININDSNTNTAGGLNLIGWSHNSEDYSAGNVRASLGATIDGGGAGSLVFRTGGFGSQAERMRIDSSGNVAIGNSSTNNRLLVYTPGATASYMQVGNGSTGLGATQGLRLGTPAAGNAEIITDGAMWFSTGNTERFRIGSAGQLGIGGANYGTSGQVLTSNGSGSAPSWQTASGNPTGTVLMWSTNVAPSGYVLCDGSAISRATFAALFAVIGTTYGAGDGSTTFNVPNFTNRMPVGSGGTYALASTGGSATTTLATTNLPAHNHSISISDPGHNHGNGGYNQLLLNNCEATAQGFDYSCAEPNISRSAAIVGNTTGITATSANTGSGTAFNTISPYLGIRFIIKT